MIRDINVLFPKVWKDIYINSQIFKHLLLFNLHYAYREYTSYESFILFNNKYYLNEVNLNFNIEYHDNFESILPENITKLSHTDSSTHIHFKSFPTFIKSLYITQYDIQLFKLIYQSNLKSLRIIYNSNHHNNHHQYNHISNINNNQHNNNNNNNNNNNSSSSYQKEIIKLTENSLPDSLVELTLINYPFKIEKSTFNNCLQLKRLVVNGGCFDIESLPQTLLEFSYGDEDSPAMKLRSNFFPSSLRVLKLFSSLDSRYIIPDGFQFPNENLVHLDISLEYIDSNFKIPSSLKSLEIEVNQSFSNILLEQLDLNGNSNGIGLKSLGFNSTNILNSNGHSVLPNSLERLVFKYFKDINYNNQLFTNQIPSFLKHLSFDVNNFNYNFENGFNNGGHSLSSDSIVFSNLVYLNFGDNFNQVINVNVLPSTLKTLILGTSFNQDIVQDSIPFNLELLRIKNKHYMKPIQLNNSYTLVDCRLYYRQFIDQDKQHQLKVFKIPWEFNQKLRELSLHNKMNLEYLDLNNFFFNRTITTGLDLPLENCIKTLVLGYPFNHTIRIEDFVHLENLVINDSIPTLIAHDVYGDINFYSLKIITIKSSNTRFIDSLNNIFYKFINIIK